MPLEFKNIARFEIVSIKKLFKKSKYSLKLIPLNSSKLNRIIYFKGLSKLGGYKFLREYLNNIRKINSILYCENNIKKNTYFHHLFDVFSALYFCGTKKRVSGYKD